MLFKIANLAYRAIIATVRILPLFAPIVLSRFTTEKAFVPAIKLKSRARLCSFPHPLFLTLEAAWFYRALSLGSTLGVCGAVVAIVCTIFEFVWLKLNPYYPCHRVPIPPPPILQEETGHGTFLWDLILTFMNFLERLVQKLEAYADHLQALSESLDQIPLLEDLKREIIGKVEPPVAATNFIGVGGEVGLDDELAMGVATMSYVYGPHALCPWPTCPMSMAHMS